MEQSSVLNPFSDTVINYPLLLADADESSATRERRLCRIARRCDSRPGARGTVMVTVLIV